MAENDVVLTSFEVSTRYDASGLVAPFLSLFLLHALSAVYMQLLLSLVFLCGIVAVFRFEVFLQPMWLLLISCTYVVNIKTSYFLVLYLTDNTACLYYNAWLHKGM